MKIETLTRQIGNEILDKKPALVDLTELDWQDSVNVDIHKMFDALNQTGGVGIAANQVAAVEAPRAIIIVGTSDPEARASAAKRYPQVELPLATVMINPKIIQRSEATYFPNAESCLSVFGNVRARVRRHQSVTVEYYDLQGVLQTETHEKMVAHIIQHELDHLAGKEFIHFILEELSSEDLQTLTDLLEVQLKAPDRSGDFDLTKNPPVASFDRSADGKVIVLWDNLKANLWTLTPSALKGLLVAVQSQFLIS